MRVVKRNGDSQEMLFDKVTKRISELCTDLEVQADKVAQKVFSDMFDGITTTQIDEISADVATHMITEHPDYETLATRVVVSNMHKTNPTCFSDSMLILHANGVVSDEFMKNVNSKLDMMIDHKRDYDFGLFGMKTLQKMYLNKGETPQYMFMRVSVAIHGDDIERVRETYDLMSQKYFTHATPTLFNAGSPRPQMSSCFLLAMKEDSVDGIFETLKRCSLYPSGRGASGCTATTSEQRDLVLQAQTVSVMVSYRCFESTIMRPDTSTRVVGARVRLRYISNRGTRTLWTFWNSDSTRATKSLGVAICSQPSGSRITLWSASSKTATGT